MQKAARHEREELSVRERTVTRTGPMPKRHEMLNHSWMGSTISSPQNTT